MIRFAVLLALALPATAQAGRCDGHAAKADTASGPALVEAYRDLVACSADEGQAAFSAFVRSAEEVDTAIALSLVAIDAQAYPPVWGMLEAIRDYGQRTAIARGVGAACGDHPHVLQFLQGAYYGLRDIQFVQWDDALQTCEADPLGAWMKGIVAAPPASSYDEKYSAVMTAWVEQVGPDALPVLQRAAVDAARKGGPFTAIIEHMDRSVQPDGLGATIPEADRKRLEEALVAVAAEVGPEQAALVADRLFNAGALAAAASLLPRVYPDRVQPGGHLLYGAAAVEQCGQEAVVHWAPVQEPARRWSILADIEEPLQGFKPRLKCEATRPWPILATAEPVAGEDDVQRWAEARAAEWADKGFQTRTRDEKPIVLD